MLEEVRSARPGALDELVSALYGELKQRAEGHMRAQRPDHTLQASALVNEAFVKLFQGAPASFADRDHFLAAASRAMRHVLVDHARGKKRDKRDGGLRQELPLDLVLEEFEQDHDLELLDQALRAFEQRDPRMAAAIEQRFFGGVPMGDLAAAQGKPLRTFERHMRAALSWMHRFMQGTSA